MKNADDEGKSRFIGTILLNCFHHRVVVAPTQESFARDFFWADHAQGVHPDNEDQAFEIHDSQPCNLFWGEKVVLVSYAVYCTSAT